MDKTGFRIGCGKGQLVITSDENKSLVMTGPDNQKYIPFAE